MLLINPPHREWGIAVSAGLGYLAAVVEQCGVKVRVIDCQVTKNYEQVIGDALKDHSMIGISVNIATVRGGLHIAEMVRRRSPQTKIVMGGPHPSAIYNKLIPQYADIVVIGEGEDTIRELIQESDFSMIKGIAYWDNGLKVNQPRSLISDLDRLSYPAWHLFDLKKYKVGNSFLPWVMLMTSRGCPYQCIYCTKLIHGSKIRLRSLENVIGEIDYLINKFGVREIWVSDDNFTFYPDRVKELCMMIINRKYKNIRFALTNGIQADIYDFEMFKLMAEAGFYWVCIGIESGAQEVRNRLGRRLDLRVVKKTVESLKKIGMQVSLFFMLGLPFDTVDTMQKTIDFAKTLPADQAYFWVTIPFPGTKLYNIVRVRGKFLFDLYMSSASYSLGEAVYEIDRLKAKDVEKMIRRAYRQFYFRPIQIWRSITKQSETLPNFFRILKFGYRILIRGERL